MDRLIRGVERVSDWMAAAGAVILGLVTVLILVEILLWNALEKTTLISDEYSAYGLAAMIFLACGYCLKEKGHIRITLILGLLPRRVAAVLTSVSAAVTTAFMGYLWWYLMLMVRSSYRYGSTSGTLTNTPLWVPQALMLVGATAFLAQLGATTLKTVRAIRTGEEVV